MEAEKLDMEKLHEPYKDDGSPSVEAEIRWLQKMGFPEHHIKQAMTMVYSELARGEIPMVWKLQTADMKKPQVLYRSASEPPMTKDGWTSENIKDGNGLCQYLLEIAKRIRTKDLVAMKLNIEDFELEMRKKWMADQNKKKSWIKRIFS